MTFAAKYRPRTLREIVGQPRATRFLSRLIADLREGWGRGGGGGAPRLAGQSTTLFLTIGLVTIGGGSALAKTVRRSLGIPEDWPLSPVFTDELVRLSVQGFLAMVAGKWRVVEAWESNPGRHARYVGVAVGKPA